MKAFLTFIATSTVLSISVLNKLGIKLLAVASSDSLANNRDYLSVVQNHHENIGENIDSQAESSIEKFEELMPNRQFQLNSPNLYHSNGPHAFISMLDAPMTALPFQVYTVAGNGILGQAIDGAVATSASVNYAEGIFLESTGNTLFLADSGNKRLRNINIVTGIINIFAGDSTDGTTGNNGPATSAKFILPYGVVGSRAGIIFVSDYSAHTIRKIDLVGIITLYGGTAGTMSAAATASNGDNGPATSATITSPRFIAMDSSNNLYLADYKNKIRKITSTSRFITTVVGTGETGSLGDSGYATAATINLPFAVFVDSMARIFLTEYGGNRIRVVSTDNTINTFAGSGSTTLSENVPATSSGINSPSGIWGNSVGDIFYMDVLNFRLRAISAVGGIVATIAGSGATNGAFVFSAAATAVPILSGRGVCGHSDGRLFYSVDSTDVGGNVVRGMYQQTQAPSVAPSAQPSTAPTVPVYQMYTVAGTGVTGQANDGEMAAISPVAQAAGVAIDNIGNNLFFTELVSYRVRKINRNTGLTYVYAGSGTSGSDGLGGQATSAQFIKLLGISVSSVSGIYVSDTEDYRVKRIGADGILTVYAGSVQSPSVGVGLFGDNGPATAATMQRLAYCALDPNDNLFIAEPDGFKIRKVDSGTKTISTVAGTGIVGYSTGLGDNNIQATASTLFYPCGIFVDSMGRIYFSEYDTSRVRVVFNNVISLFAGDGTVVMRDNVPATSTGVKTVTGIWGNTMGDIFFSDAGNVRLRVVSMFSGLVNTIAGSGAPAPTLFQTFGAATALSLVYLEGVVGESSGGIIVADAGIGAIRGIYASTQAPSMLPTMLPTQLPTITMQPSTQPSQAPTVPVYEMYTVAGNGVTGASLPGAIATSSSVKSPFGLFVDSSGNNLYFCDSGNFRIRKVNMASGISDVFVGSGSSGMNGDSGQATAAQLINPVGFVALTSGTAYMSDYYDKIRKIATDGIITTYGGNGVGSTVTTAPNGDGGPATSATLWTPTYMAVDTANNLYFCDFRSNKVRKINYFNQIISTVAGNGDGSYYGNGGFATAAAMFNPIGVFVDSVGKIYIALHSSCRIQIVNTAGIINLFAGDGTLTTTNNIAATATGMKNPRGLWGNTMGDIFYADQNNYVLRVASAHSGTVSTIAGSGSSATSSFVSMGAATIIPLIAAEGVGGDSSGRIYVSDASMLTGGSAVRGMFISTSAPSAVPSIVPLVTPSTQPSQAPTVNFPVYQAYVVAGNGLQGSATDGAAASSSRLSVPYGLFLESARINLFIADGGNCRVRKVNLVTGITNVFAGDGNNALAAGSGAATSSSFSKPISVIGNTAGHIFVIDQDSHCVRRINTAGIISTIAGGTTCDNTGDKGPATSAKLCYPAGIAIDSSNNMYVSIQLSNCIRKVNLLNGIITKFAGSNIDASDGNGGFATSASIKSPFGLFVDSAGRVYVTELSGNRVRVIGTDNKINHFAGLSDGEVGETTLVENVPASATGINSPRCIWGNTIGDIFFADDGNYKFRAVRAVSGLVNTIAGNGASTSGELVLSGAATSITILSPEGIVGDVNGNLFISDKSYTSGGNSVRGMYVGTSAPTLLPSVVPSAVPTLIPSRSMQPSMQPSQAPTTIPTLTPSQAPTTTPSQLPTITMQPSTQPSQAPTIPPTVTPSMLPSVVPTISSAPSMQPSQAPTVPVYQMFTVAGNGVTGASIHGAVATSSSVFKVEGVYADTASNVYFTDSGNYRVRKVNLASRISYIFAFNGVQTYAGNNGPVTSASIRYIRGISATTSGVFFVGDSSDNRIRMIATNGIVTDFTGTGSASAVATQPNGDGGPATSATLNNPFFMSLDTSNNLYIAEGGNSKIRKVGAVDRIITTIAGTGTAGTTTGDSGQATAATFNNPVATFVDSVGKVYVTEYNGNRVRVIAVNGIITTVLGTSSGGTLPVENVPGTSSGMSGGVGIWGNTVGDIFVADQSNYRIRVVSAFSGLVTNVAGSGLGWASSFVGSGPALTIPVMNACGVHGDSAGRVFFAEINEFTGGSSVRGIYTSTQAPSISPTQLPTLSMQPTITMQPSTQPSQAPTVPVYQMYTVAGTGVTGQANDGEVAAISPVAQAAGVAVDKIGNNLFFTEIVGYRVRKVTRNTGLTYVYAGSGTSGRDGIGGQATSAQFVKLFGISVSSVSGIYVSDTEDYRLKRIGEDGILTVYAGSVQSLSVGVGLFGDNGAATAATMQKMGYCALDPDDNLFIAEPDGFKIRKVDAGTKTISTVAGTGIVGYSTGLGDNNIQATASILYYPNGIFVDSVGMIYFTEYNSNRIRAVYNNVITLWAGDGTVVVRDNVPATSTAVKAVIGIWGNTLGDIYFSDTGNVRLRVVNKFSGLVNTIAGSGAAAPTVFQTFGAATAMSLAYLEGVVGDLSGGIVVADAGISAIRGIYASTQSPSMLPTTTPSAQPSQAPTVPVYQMYTVVGNGVAGVAAGGAVATSSSVRNVEGVFVDSTGNDLYFSDANNHRVRKVNLVSGVSNYFAFNGIQGYAGENGQATSAGVAYVRGVWGTTSGVVFVADSDAQKVRAISVSGIVTTIAGTGAQSTTSTLPNGDSGPATSATCNTPHYISLDSSGNLYIADLSNFKIRKINAIGQIITTFAGTGAVSTSGDGGQATAATFNQPVSTFVDSVGKVYVIEYAGYRVRVIDTNGIIATVVGTSTGSSTLAEDVSGTSAGLKGPVGIWGNTVGDIYFADNGNFRVRVLSAFSGLVKSVAGSGAATAASYVLIGPALTIPVIGPCGLHGSRFGQIYIADYYAGIGGSAIRAIYASTQSPSTTPSVTPTVTPSVVPSTLPSKVPSISPSVTPSFVPSQAPTMVPSISPSNPPTVTPTITMQPSTQPSQAPTVPIYQMYTVAGNGVQGEAIDGAIATSSSVRNVESVFVDSTGNDLYFSDTSNFRMRKVHLISGINNYFAFNGIQGYAGDNGPATSAGVIFVRGVWGTTSGVMFTADSGAHCVRYIAVNGIVTTYAGSGMQSTMTTLANGDGGPATSATLNTPHFISLDSSGNLYIADLFNCKIRIISAIGQIITTLAGTGAVSTSGDGGQATAATINLASAIFVNSVGKVYFTELAGSRVRVIDTNGIIATAVGTVTGSSTLYEDVPGTSTGLSNALGIWVNTIGDIFYVDNGNHRVRVLSAFSGLVTSVAGSGVSWASSFVGSGPALTIPLLDGCGLHGSPSGQIYISDYTIAVGGSAIRAIYASTPSPTVVPSSAPTVMPTLTPSREPSTTQPSISPTTTQPSAAPIVPVYQMYTVVGNGAAGSAADGAVATSSSVSDPRGVVLDNAANFLFLVERGNHRVRKVNLNTGMTNVFAGVGTSGSGGIGGPATSAQFYAPIGISYSTSATVFLSDSDNNRVLKILPAGTVTIFAGGGGVTVDNIAATSASLGFITWNTLDTANNLYFADYSAYKVRKVNFVTNIISIVAGTGTQGPAAGVGSNNIPATSSMLAYPNGIFVDSIGKVYFGEQGGNRIRSVFNGIIVLFAGDGTTVPKENVPATSTGLNSPRDIWGNSVGDIVFTDQGNNGLKVVSAFSGLVTTVAGSGAGSASSFIMSGLATSVALPGLEGITGDDTGRFVVSASASVVGGSVVRAIVSNTQSPTATPSVIPSVTPSILPSVTLSMIPSVVPSVVPSAVPTIPTVTPSWVPTTAQPSQAPTVSIYQMYTVAGNGAQGEAIDGAIATSSSVRNAESVFVDTTGNNLYFSDAYNFRVRKVNLVSGINNYFAFNGIQGIVGDNGQATSAGVVYVRGVWGTTLGVVFIVDSGAQRVRAIDVNGIVTTYAGTGAPSASGTLSNGDGGPATSATLNEPHYISLDSSGNLYIADLLNFKIRKISAIGQIITTFAGTGSADTAGDGGQATSAAFNQPIATFVDSVGKVYVTELAGNRVRVIDENGFITTLVGTPTGSSTLAEDVPGTSTGLNGAKGIWVNTVGDIYFVDNGNHNVRVLSAFSGLVNTIAGSGAGSSDSFVSSGHALTIPLIGPCGLHGSQSGQIYVADYTTAVGGNTVRGIYISTQSPTVMPTVTPIPSVAPSSLPSEVPTTVPTVVPSILPTQAPSIIPSMMPSMIPSVVPSALPSSVPTVEPSILPSVIPSMIPSGNPSAVPSQLPTLLPSIVPSSLPTVTPSATPSLTPTTTPSVTPSVEPSVTPSVAPSATPSVTPTTTPSVTPSLTPSVTPSATPSVTPTTTPSVTPSVTPSEGPSISPSVVPSVAPSVTPSEAPSLSPSVEPSGVPSDTPSYAPTDTPTQIPSELPCDAPSLSPSVTPTVTPSTSPSTTPSLPPTREPTITPSIIPSCEPTVHPTVSPTVSPSTVPSTHPSVGPTTDPSRTPSGFPTLAPSETPSASPSITPSLSPSVLPSVTPTSAPSVLPTVSPTIEPTVDPTSAPTIKPTTVPSITPSIEPSRQPSSQPSNQPSSQPTCKPSSQPTETPSIQPTMQPSCQPTSQPFAQPTNQPSSQPSSQPVSRPSSKPSVQPSIQPTLQPQSKPSSLPSNQPTLRPSRQPSSQPSMQPSANPTQPTSQPSSHPSKYTQSPTFAPTWFTRGTFPSNNSISVLFESNDVNGYRSAAQFKIVLPFLRVTSTSQLLTTSGFYDVYINTALSTGSNSVLYGNLTSSRVSLSSLAVGSGFVLSPAVSFDHSGRSVSNAGDINGDGYNDLIIGVPYAARCYVLFGTAQGFMNMKQGFTVFGAQLSDLTGWSVSGAGDVNNDTLSDIIIGAPYARNGIIGSGAAYVLYGKRYGFQDVRVDALSPEQGFTIFGSGEGDTLGVSVSSAGDVNGNGYDDIVIGALKSTSSYRGGAYVVYGSNLTQRSTLYLSALEPQEGFAMVGAVWSYSGYSVSGASDVNSDRFDDVLVGSVPFKTSFGVQTTYLVYGSRSITNSINLATLSKQRGVVILGGGVVVSGVGDINHDGYDDIMISSIYGFTGASFVVFTNITNQITTNAPSVVPTTSPSTLGPTPSPSRRPTENPSLSPTRQPILVPSLCPTVLQSGPSEPPTEAPTGPTSRPTSSPTVNTEQPTNTPSTSNPSSRPSVKPSSRPTTLPTAATKRPSLQPTLVPSTHTPSVEISSNPSFRSRNPIIRVTVSPTQAGNRFENIIVVGGSYEKHQNESTNYVVDTPDIVNITGHGSKAGDIYTVLPKVNGSLHIEIFNNISDKLNLTSHSSIHSMPDLVITSGSVIITFPTTGQRIRLANLTPLDISENNFIFASNKYKSSEESASSRIFIISFSSAVVLLIVLFILYQLFRRSQAYKERMEQHKAGIIALEDNPTRLIVAVNDMYAHFDAYIPNNHLAEEQVNGGNNSSSLKYVSEDSKSNVDENSPLNSFETQNSVTVRKHKQNNSGSVFSSGGIVISSSGSKSDYNNSAYNSGFYDSYRIESGHNSYHTSQNSSLKSMYSSLNSVSKDSVVQSEIRSSKSELVEDEQSEQSSTEHSYNDEISMDSDMMSMV